MPANSPRRCNPFADVDVAGRACVSVLHLRRLEPSRWCRPLERLEVERCGHVARGWRRRLGPGEAEDGQSSELMAVVQVEASLRRPALVLHRRRTPHRVAHGRRARSPESACGFAVNLRVGGGTSTLTPRQSLAGWLAAEEVLGGAPSGATSNEPPEGVWGCES